MVSPMDAAWSVLKADPFYRVYTRGLGDEQGRYSSQAMHPAIAGMFHRTSPPGSSPGPSPFIHRRELQDIPEKKGYSIGNSLRRDATADRRQRMGERDIEIAPASAEHLIPSTGYFTDDWGMDTQHYVGGTDGNETGMHAPIGGDMPVGVSVSTNRGTPRRHYPYEDDGVHDIYEHTYNYNPAHSIMTPDEIIDLIQIPGAAPTIQNRFQGSYDPNAPQNYAPLSQSDTAAFREMFDEYMKNQKPVNDRLGLPTGNPDNIQMLPGNFMQQV